MESLMNIIEKNIYPILSPAILALVRILPAAKITGLNEIRIRVNRPLLLRLDANRDFMPSIQVDNGKSSYYLCTQEDIDRTLQLITKNSIYALEQELKSGFITIAGGHRIGLAGQAITVEGKLVRLKNISSINIRIAREIRGCANNIMPFITDGPRVFSTLIISPPCAGKTTILRDIVRQLSSGIQKLAFNGVQVGVVDERSEIAACEHGVPTVDIGCRTDVLDACPKAEGMLLLIRTMSPDVVVSDEIGRNEDIVAVREALNAGVSVIVTAHAHNIEELTHRPGIDSLINARFFDRYVILSNKQGPGTIERIVDVKNNATLYTEEKGVKICG